MFRPTARSRDGSFLARWEGAGNRFLLHDGRGADGRSGVPPDAAVVCGAAGVDGLIALGPPRTPGAAASVRFFNADGSAAGACGNGLRCAALCLDPTGERGVMNLDAPAGLGAAAVLNVAATDGDRLSGTVRVSMGRPRFPPPPADLNAFNSLHPGGTATGESARPGLAAFGPPILVDLGNPHAVLMLDEPPADDLVANLGAAFQAHPYFEPTGGVNVGFAFVRRPDLMTLRVYERSVGETASCGSGACAAVAAAVAVKRCVRRVTVRMPGGELIVERSGGGELFLTGPAERTGFGVR